MDEFAGFETGSDLANFFIFLTDGFVKVVNFALVDFFDFFFFLGKLFLKLGFLASKIIFFLLTEYSFLF